MEIVSLSLQNSQHGTINRNKLNRGALMIAKCIFFFSLLFFGIQGHARLIPDLSLASFNYIVCLHGGSKTSLQILDRGGKPLALEQHGRTSQIFFGTSSNINNVGSEGFAQVLNDLFQSLLVGEQKIPFSSLQGDCLVIGGIAGLSNPANLEKAKAIFQSKGFRMDRLILAGDVHLALELVDDTGIVLIAGTGSVALGIEDGNECKAGGFGRILGDEGSGYAMGIRALQSALEEELGYGKSTCLSNQIKSFYRVEKIRDLIPSINSGAIQPSEIAQLAPHVFASAQGKDPIAGKIVAEAAQDLSKLMLHVLSRMHASDRIPVVLMGELFQDNPVFIEQIFQSEPLHSFLEQEQKSIALFNLSEKNIASQVAQKYQGENVKNVIQQTVEEINKTIDSSTHIQLLKNCPEVIPTLAEWIYEDWSPYDRALTKEKMVMSFKGRLNDDQLPCVLVALKDSQPVGVISLKIHGDPELADLDNGCLWVGSLHVIPEERGHGVGEALAKSIVTIAKRLGYEEVRFYLSESKGAQWCVEHGAEILEMRPFRGHTIAILRYTLTGKDL